MSFINPYIFREYDVRGIVEKDFPDHIVKKLGQAFGTFVRRSGGKEIAISGDVRLSTPLLINAFKNGVLTTGVDIINLGILPTPVNYFSMFHLGIAASVQVTGSHNPPDFNGFKFSLNKSPFYGKQIQTLYKMMDQMDFDKGEGTEARYNILSEYNHMIEQKIKIEKPMKVIIDCGNAAGCINAPSVFNGLGIETKELFCDPDGTFPNHHPDPTIEENLSAIVSEMKTGKYDVGLAFDGDADRVGVVDDRGEIIWADQLMAIFLPEIIKNNEEILFDVKCSQSLIDMIIKYGGKPVMCKTGHSIIKNKMKEIDCKFGGEMSGHIFFADDYYGYDDALYVGARLVQLLSRSNKKLSQLKSIIPTYYSTPELRMEANSEQEKFEIVEKAIIYFKENYDCITIDGVRIQFEDGWGLVRSSNTQPVIVCRFEAKSPERLDQIRNLIIDKISELGELKLNSH
ncbi:MAG: phosphomannomutase [Candidatus Marinimicrobia bacterium]|nr:phosphomannomutase [Candidatus Neomarinimicrobiota bacterium]